MSKAVTRRRSETSSRDLPSAFEDGLIRLGIGVAGLLTGAGAVALWGWWALQLMPCGGW